jgi:hypothetical protein
MRIDAAAAPSSGLRGRERLLTQNHSSMPPEPSRLTSKESRRGSRCANFNAEHFASVAEQQVRRAAPRCRPPRAAPLALGPPRCQGGPQRQGRLSPGPATSSTTSSTDGTPSARPSSAQTSRSNNAAPRSPAPLRRRARRSLQSALPQVAHHRRFVARDPPVRSRPREVGQSEAAA